MTYEEISTKYPVGKLLYRKVEKSMRVSTWRNEEEKEMYRKLYPDAQFTNNGAVAYTVTHINERRVEGWIVTSDGFFVAEDLGDGEWEIVFPETLNRWEKIGIDYEF